MTKRDNKGRVLRQSELIANELQDLFSKNEQPYTREWLKELAAYILQRVDDDHWPTLRQGIAIGRQEGLAMAEATIPARRKLLNNFDDNDAIGFGFNQAVEEQRKALAQAVEAVKKGIQIPKDEYIRLASKVEAIQEGKAE